MQIIEIGSVLGGHRIDAIAGRGGMGIVYLATHLRLERQVALKVVNPMFADDESFAERFQRESRVAASLRHPHIVTVHDAGEDRGLLFITMEYVEGTDMREMLKEHGALEPREAARLITQTASALDAAHQRGLVHRDVKPANILVHGRGETAHAYLTDFGLTRHASSVGALTNTGQWVGTIDYVAPEQVEGRSVDGRSDVYSLACVLFEAVSGSVPFTQDSDLAKLWARISEEPPRLRDRAPGASEELDSIVAWGMAQDPEQRFGSAGEFARVAADALAGRPTSISPDPSAPSTAASARASTTAPGAATTAAEETAAATTKAAATAAGTDGRADTERRSRRIRGGRRLALLGGGIALLATGAGFALGAVTGEDSGGTTVEEGEIALTHDDAWERDVSGGRPIDGLSLEDPIALDYTALAGAGILRAGTLADPAAGPDPLPEALRKRFRRPPQPDPVDVNGAEGIRYEGRVRGGERPTSASLLLVPFESGYVAVGCEAPRSDLDSFGPACETVQGTLRLVDGKPVGLAPDTQLVTALEKSLAAAGEAQSETEPGLASDDPTRQAEAARQISDAYRDAAATLQDVEPRPQDAAALNAVVGALSDLEAEFGHLADAAEAEAAGEHRAARQGIAAASDRLDEALAELSESGYRLQ